MKVSKENDFLLSTLFIYKVAETDASQLLWCKHHATWKIVVEAHLVQDGSH